MLNVLSLGAGVQSSTVLLMSDCGELPPLDCAIFADTGWEPKAVYEHLERLKAAVSIPIHVVTAGNIREENAKARLRFREMKDDGKRIAAMPLITVQQDGTKGMIKRQCTKEYKIEPIEKFIKSELLGIKPRARWPKERAVRQWFGISRDEFRRCRPSHAAWKSNYYPLVGMEFYHGHKTERTGDRPMTRLTCLEWLREHGWHDVPRSACIGCPFHSDAEWRALEPDEFADACDFDRSIRKGGGMRGDMFIHQRGVPLEVVDLRTDADRGQLSLWQDECEGLCGV